MNSLLNKLRKRKSSSDAVSIGSNSSLFNSGTISICPYSVNEKNLPPFLKAVWKNDLIKVKKLIKKNYNVVDQDKRSGLHLACAAGFIETIKELLSNYANEILEKRDINKKTALYKAVEKGINENVQLLLDKGAKTDVKDDMGESLIHAAIRYKHADILRHLLQKDINCNETNKEGMSPLHLAAELNFIDGMNLLLRHTRDIDACANNGKTALMIAAESGYDKAVKVLLSNNADASIDDKPGYDALYYATFHEHTECIRLLKEVDPAYSIKPESSPKHTVTLEAPKFLETLSSSYNNGSLKSENSNADIEHVIPKSKPLQNDKQKEDSKIRKFHSQETVQSNGTWMGEFTNTSSDATIDMSHKTLAIHDISTPSSMPNPSDIDINPSRPAQSSLYNSQFKRSMSDDEESQWSNNDKSHMESSRDRFNEVVAKASKENVGIKTEIEIEKTSDSEWDSDDTEHQDIQVKLSTIDEESAGKKSRISFLKSPKLVHQKSNHDQDSSDLSMMLKPSYGDDDNLTDSNIEECFKTNYIVTNPPIMYDSVDNLSVDEDTDTDGLNDLYSSQITNANYKQSSLAPSSKPPKSPSVIKQDQNIPTITIEEFTPKTHNKNRNLQGGDNISSSSTEPDVNIKQGFNSDSIHENNKSNMYSSDEYIKKCSQLESKLLSLESEKNFLQLNINSIKESKDKSEIERLKLQNQYQKLETTLSENTDKLSDFEMRYVGIEEQLTKREKELFEVKKAKQELEDKFKQLEISNLTSSSKMKQEDFQDYRKKYDDELKDWIKTSDELKTEINNLKKQLTAKNNETYNDTTEHSVVVQNLKDQIAKQVKAMDRENEDKISLQEEIDQLRKTIKNLNSDLESSNKTMALATKQERENSGLKDQIQDMDKRISQLTKDNERLNTESIENKKNMNKNQLEIDRLENQLKLKDDSISLLKMQYKTFENQSLDLEKLVERKQTEHKELENKYFTIETELKMEMKKNKNALEIANDVIKPGTINGLDSSELLEALQNIKRSLNNADIEVDWIDKLEKLETPIHNEVQNKLQLNSNQQELTQLDRENMELKECLREERQKHQLLYEKDKSLSIQLRNEIKKRKQLSETLDSVNYWLDKYNKQINVSIPSNPHLVSSQIDIVDNGYSSIPNKCSVLLQNFADMNDGLQMKLKKSEWKFTEFQSQKSSLDKNQEIVNENSQNLLTQQLGELTQIMENQRVNREKLEKLRDENEFQLRTDLYQTKQQNMMEISQLANKTSIIDEDRQVLMQQNKILNEALAKERELKDSLTEQLVNLVKASYGSSQQLNGYEPIFKSSNGFNNSTSQLSIPMNLIDNEKRSLANSMLNLNIPKSIGVEDEELRQKLRKDLDRSIARHLESGKPIRQLNIKEKIRSLSIGRYPISTVSWKSP